MFLTTKPLTSSASNAYGLRDSTNIKSQESKLDAASKPTPVKSRKVMDISASASRIRPAGHNCKLVDISHIADKVAARLLLSLSRFAMAYAFNCQTLRGKTHINGTRSSCGGCHAAHAALSCKLYDNILEIARTDLLEKSFDELTPIYQRFLQCRFDLSAEDEQALQSENHEVRIEKFDSLASELTSRQRRMSFAGTLIEFMRGSTYENPISSNKFDSYLESRLRPLEDTLAEKCRLEEITPAEALATLLKEYRKLVTDAIDHLKTDLENLDHLHEAWENMLSLQSEEKFEDYLAAIDNYLAAFFTRFKGDKLPGTPGLKEFKTYLMDHQHIHTLKRLQATRSLIYYQENRQHLTMPKDADMKFTQAVEEDEIRLTEALYQFDGLNKSAAEIEDLLKYSYGKKDEKGELQAPTKDQIAKVCLASLQK